MKQRDKNKKPPRFDDLTKKSSRHRRKRRSAVAMALIVSFGALAFGGAVTGFGLWAEGAELDPDLLPTASNLPVFLDCEGNKIDYRMDNYVDPECIPENVKNAFVALEDKRFYSHDGYDLTRMAGAVLHNIKAGHAVEGASTITQQLVKNTHLSAEKTVSRKLNEIALAMKVEQRYSKDEILAMYLSVIYFGGGAYGINAASKLYFGCTPDELTVSQAATLAGILRNPSRYSPKNSIANATKRRNTVLDVMCREGYLTQEETEAAKNEKIVLAGKDAQAGYADYYIRRAISEVTEALGITKYQLDNSGFVIMTNMDSSLQKKLASEAADSTNFSNIKGTDSAAVVVDNLTGAVRAHYSSLNYEVSRQAGSVLKPLTVYAPAFSENLISAATPVVDERINVNGYSPENYGGVYYGETTPREALKKSMNSVAVKVMSYVGSDKALAYARKFGLPLSDEDSNYSLALGATRKGVTPISLAGAYSALARGGTYIKPTYVSAVICDGNKIYSAETSAPVRVVSEDGAYLTTSCLVDTVKDGTARSLSVLPFDLASKTGTVQKGETNTDAWNVSYSSRHTVVVWHGASSFSELGGGHPTRHCAEIWKSVYEVKDKPPVFARPATVVSADIDVYSTSKNKKVTAAGFDTPVKYRKTELFSLSSLPDTSGSRFETAVPPQMELIVAGDKIGIKISAEEIYRYEVIKSDVAGQHTMCEINGADIVGAAGETYVELSDYPLPYGLTKYTVLVYLDTPYGSKPMGEVSKTVAREIGFNR